MRQSNTTISLLCWLALLVMPYEANALSFRDRSYQDNYGNWIIQIQADGTIIDGDTDRLRAYISQIMLNREIKDTPETFYVLSLNSDGGSVSESIAIGTMLHKRLIKTLVKKGNGCYSACALAFLGGTLANTTGPGSQPRKRA